MAHSTRLSKREEEVYGLLLQGKSNKQIAFALGISESTVEFHLRNVYSKLQISSRAEAFSRLRESTGINTVQKPRKPIVEKTSEKTDNEDEPVLQRPETSAMTSKISSQGCDKFMRKYIILISVGVLLGVIMLAVILVRLFPEETLAPTPQLGQKYERECENPDASTVGQMIWRSNASGSKVHGQFGTTSAAPWPAKSGYVQFTNINLVPTDHLSLKLRYSKNSPSSAPILIYLDNETTPRATIYPTDQGNWDQFVWTEPIFLGSIGSGVHSIKFSTHGQQYGVADLDLFVLSGESP